MDCNKDSDYSMHCTDVSTEDLDTDMEDTDSDHYSDIELADMIINYIEYTSREYLKAVNPDTYLFNIIIKYVKNINDVPHMANAIIIGDTNEDTNEEDDIEMANAAIKEIEEAIDITHILQTAFSMGNHSTQHPKVKIELYDSGASCHMSPFLHHFTNYCTIPPCPITAANKCTFYAIGTGNLQIDIPNGQTTTPIILCNTLHTPEMALTIVLIR
jgi:hypothetical protein